MGLDHFFVDLVDDPYLASVQLLNRVRPVGDNDEEYNTACAVLEVYFEINNWVIPVPLRDEKSTIREMFGANRTIPEDVIALAKSKWRRLFAAFELSISSSAYNETKRKAREALGGLRPDSFGYAVLSSEEKNEIQGYIEKIRLAIEVSNIDDRKKNALYVKLSELSSEVNRNGTRTDRFFAFASELAFVAGQMVERGKPAFEEFRKILKIVVGSRAKREQTELPKPEDYPLLPS